MDDLTATTLTDLRATVQRLSDELANAREQLAVSEALVTAAIKWFHDPGNPSSDPVFAAAVWSFLKDEHRRARENRRSDDNQDQTP